MKPLTPIEKRILRGLMRGKKRTIAEVAKVHRIPYDKAYRTLRKLFEMHAVFTRQILQGIKL